MGKDRKQFYRGDKIFGKVRGYPPWPARIQDIVNEGTKQAKYHVFFYGTYERGILKVDDIFDYEVNKEKFRIHQKRKQFADGMREIEENPDIECPTAMIEVSKPKTKIRDESDDEGHLVIDEHMKFKKTEYYSDKPVSKLKRHLPVLKKPVIIEPETIQISRSGRKIKPKKFDDDFDDLQSGKHHKEGEKKNSKEFLGTYNYDQQLESPGLSGYSSENEDSEEEYKKKKQSESSLLSNQRRGNQETTVNSLRKKFEEQKKLLKESKEAVLKAKELDVDSKKRKLNTSDIKNEPEHVAKKTKKDSKVDETSRSSQEKYKVRALSVVSKSGLSVDVLYNHDRPKYFQSKPEKEEWKKASARKLHQCKMDIENGKFIPFELKVHLCHLEARKLSNDKAGEEASDLSCNERSLRWLTNEYVLVGLDSCIVKTLQYNTEKDINHCLALLNDLLNIPIDPFMLVKNPQVVFTVRKCMKFSKHSSIRDKASQVFKRFRQYFEADDDSSFHSKYSKQLAEFSKHTESMPEKSRLLLTCMPSKKQINIIKQDNIINKEERKLADSPVSDNEYSDLPRHRKVDEETVSQEDDLLSQEEELLSQEEELLSQEEMLSQDQESDKLTKSEPPINSGKIDGQVDLISGLNAVNSEAQPILKTIVDNGNTDEYVSCMNIPGAKPLNMESKSNDAVCDKVFVKIKTDTQAIDLGKSPSDRGTKGNVPSTIQFTEDMQKSCNVIELSSNLKSILNPVDGENECRSVDGVQEDSNHDLDTYDSGKSPQNNKETTGTDNSYETHGNNSCEVKNEDIGRKSSVETDLEEGTEKQSENIDTPALTKQSSISKYDDLFEELNTDDDMDDSYSKPSDDDIESVKGDDLLTGNSNDKRNNSLSLRDSNAESEFSDTDDSSDSADDGAIGRHPQRQISENSDSSSSSGDDS